ncbi:CRISPR-associated protein Csb1 [Desulfomicrobium apsheronum]|uniref:CRISPR-associated protein Csb1 n=1 Tax=Desulfomicrobium apsheronum TaxID=52560 RepID=A0A1I3WF54_9BACT|nr:type I-U CRISPR-associated RAMP protein Csb1/Cas7u [Desulfomicrobium apsheronum]SFK06030.1 CRISPR-associated protein Csb1 [Desulfomicrobium apsheronum]
MTLDLSALDGVNRLLFSIPLEPLQGHRFQPTGFPALGAATFSTKYGPSLLVESAQSMANRLELTIWDETKNDVKTALLGLSHIRVKRGEEFLTDSLLESHRINSPYILEGSDKTFFNQIKSELDVLETGPINRSKLSKLLLKYDICSLLHGVFLAKKELAGGRLRLSRSVEAFIEADGVRVAASGGVKNDHVNPSGDTKSGFGNVPFARDEYTADFITLYAKVDLAQIRGYGLGEDVTKLLITLALYKIRVLLNSDLRLRTACDLRVVNDVIAATKPSGFILPNVEEIESELTKAIAACKDNMKITVVTFNDELKKGKDKGESAGGEQTEPDEN